MNKSIGLRREDKNRWEIRVPVIPDAVKEINQKYGIKTIVQPFPLRAYSHEEYLESGAEINEDLSNCNTIFAVKEIPIPLLMENKTYLFFSHTIKGQRYNMPLLKRLMELKVNLIDYECIKDDSGRRLVFFGRFAGLAGMIDALHGYGKRLQSYGKETIFLKVKPAYEYKDLEEAKLAIKEIGDELKEKGFDCCDIPNVFAFAGYGNVSKGAQEIFDLLPYKSITPEELKNIKQTKVNYFYKIVFKEEDMVEPISKDDKFELMDYYNNPHKYKSKFENYLPFINILVNAIYWEKKYPRLVTKEYLRNNNFLNLHLISDISCDIDGAIEITSKSTYPNEPAYVYNPNDDSIVTGYEGVGVVNMAVDNLPCELPRDSSKSFSDSLLPLINEIVNCDFNDNYEILKLCNAIKNAIIVHRGELTPKYKYLEKLLEQGKV